MLIIKVTALLDMVVMACTVAIDIRITVYIVGYERTIGALELAKNDNKKTLLITTTNCLKTE